MPHTRYVATTWWCVLAALMVATLAVLGTTPRANADRLDYESFLRQVIDLDNLPRLQPGGTRKGSIT